MNTCGKTENISYISFFITRITIAAGKAVPFIIFMDNGFDVRSPGEEAPMGPRPQGAPQGQRPQGGQRPGGFGRGIGGFNAFQEILLKDIIPMVESNYRVIADAQHRGMAGLSMGGIQTYAITLANHW
jgi:enterochelin esterase family protein